MRTSGPRIVAQLEQALAAARAAAAKCGEDRLRLEGEIDRVVADRGAALLELSRLYLPDLSRETISELFDGVRADILGIAERRERSRAEIVTRIERLGDEHARLRAAAAEGQLESEQRAQRRDAAQATIAERLATHARFQEVAVSIAQAESALEQHVRRVEELRHEAQAKLPAYQRSRLFQYLHARKFGTGEYGFRGLTRTLDRWTARLIDYERARRGYEFLTSTPKLMEADAVVQRARLNAALAEAQAIQESVDAEIGLHRLVQECEQATREVAARQQRASDAQARVERAQQELLALDETEGRFHQEALVRFQAFLSQLEAGVLQERAQRTPTAVDDEIASRINWLTQELARLRSESATCSAEYHTVEVRAAGLEFVVRRCEQSELKSERAYFTDFPIETVLEQHRLGAMDKDALWQTIKRAGQFDPTWAETKAVEALRHPASQVLLEAVGRAAGERFRRTVERGFIRRGEG